MTIAATALSLADYALNSNSPAVKAITYSLIENGSVFQDIPCINNESLVANGVRFEGNLPVPNWVQINAEGTTVKGTPTPYAESAYIVRNYIDVDKFLLRDKNQISDPRATQTGAFIKGLTYDQNYKFIKNDHTSGDTNSFVGLRFRIDNGGKFGVRSENKINASALDVSQAGATQATANKFLELLDQLLWSVDSPDGAGVILYMNEVMKRRFAFLLRLMGTSGGFDVERDQFDRVVQMYKGAIVRDIGYKADQSTRIITTTEDSSGNDASSTYTSIYAVNISGGHLFAWQFEEPQAQDLGLLNNGAIYRTLIDWAVGLMNDSNRSIGRIYGLKMA